MVLKQYGCRASGTKWIVSLLQSNYVVDINVGDPYWKHCYFRELSDIDGYIISVKHPHAWLVSVKRYYHRAEVKGDVHSRPLAEHWMHKNASYLQAREERDDVFIVRYEDLLQDPITQLEKISSFFDLEKEKEGFDIEEREKAPKGMWYEEVEDADEANRRYYLEEEFYDDLPEEEFDQMNRHFFYLNEIAPWEALGYDLEMPSADVAMP